MLGLGDPETSQNFSFFTQLSFHSFIRGDQSYFDGVFSNLKLIRSSYLKKTAAHFFSNLNNEYFNLERTYSKWFYNLVSTNHFCSLFRYFSCAINRVGTESFPNEFSSADGKPAHKGRKISKAIFLSSNSSKILTKNV